MSRRIVLSLGVLLAALIAAPVSSETADGIEIVRPEKGATALPGEEIEICVRNVGEFRMKTLMVYSSRDAWMARHDELDPDSPEQCLSIKLSRKAKGRTPVYAEAWGWDDESATSDEVTLHVKSAQSRGANVQAR